MQLLKLKRKWRKRQVCDIWWGERRIFFDGYEDNIEVDGKLILFYASGKSPGSGVRTCTLVGYVIVVWISTHIFCAEKVLTSKFITQMWYWRQSKRTFFFITTPTWSTHCGTYHFRNSARKKVSYYMMIWWYASASWK